MERKIVSIVSVLALSAFAGSVAVWGSTRIPDVEVSGKVLATFDEGFALVETKTKIVRIRLSELGFLQRQKLKLLSSEMRLKVPQHAIDLSWNLFPAPGLGIAEAKLETVPAEKLNSHDGIVEIVGRRLPSIPSDTAFVQVKDMIYVIDKGKVPPESRMRLDSRDVIAYLPQSSVLFSWKVESKRAATGNPPREEIAVVGNTVKIVGRSVLSFEAPYSLVQANGSVMQLRRQDLSGEQRSQLDRIGSSVRMHVPKNSVRLMWRVPASQAMKAQAPHPEQLP